MEAAFDTREMCHFFKGLVALEEAKGEHWVVQAQVWIMDHLCSKRGFFMDVDSIFGLLVLRCCGTRYGRHSFIFYEPLKAHAPVIQGITFMWDQDVLSNVLFKFLLL